jgi:pilus assembly protein CpaC
VGGVQQVQLDVVVAIVSRSAFRRMAFDSLGNSANFYYASVTTGAAAAPTTVGTGGTLGAASGGLQGTVGGPNGAGTNLLFGVLHNGWNFLGFLQALREEDVLKLIAEPKLVTLSGQPASFISGGEQAIPVPAGLGQVGVQFEEFGSRLNFLPIVLGDGRIHLEVEPEVSTLGGPGGLASTTISNVSVQGRQTQRVHTTVELETGQTFVIGGLIQRTVNGSTTKVPLLGQLPFIGAFFSTKSYSEDEEELVVLVTPHLVDAQSHDQLTKIIPGQETRSPDDFELFLEGILEAPRGPREVFQGTRYVPAYRNGPTADLFPCAGQNDGIHAQALRPVGGTAQSWSGGGAPCTVESEAQAAPAVKQQAPRANMPQAAQPSKILEGTPATATPKPATLAPATLAPAGDNAAGGQIPTVSAVPRMVPPLPSSPGGALSAQMPVAPAAEPATAATPASVPVPEASTPSVPSTGGTQQP